MTIKRSFGDYSSEIASTGHTEAQLPQLTQASALMVLLSSCSVIADAGHSPSHAPQFMQVSAVILNAILYLSFMDFIAKV